MENTFDHEYVEALQKQAENMVHQLQLVTEQAKGKGNLSKEVVICGANKAVSDYFEMINNYNNE